MSREDRSRASGPSLRSEGESGCLLDEIQNPVEPIERRTMDGPAGPQRGTMPERCGRSHAFDSPVPGEHMGEQHACERQYMGEQHCGERLDMDV
jgi:hypothetical protein